MSSAPMPALFIGHGSPRNAIDANPYTPAWAALAKRFPRPQQIVAISAHWETKGVLITLAERPRTIHDFYNFPAEMYAITYPAPGSPALARRIEQMLAPYARADLDGWGLDHGTWTVLRAMYPEADIPVVQVSLDLRRSCADHYAIGRVLGQLRDEGVLILGTGNIVHNLRYPFRGTEPLPWATAFDAAVQEKLVEHDDAALIDYANLTKDAQLAVPEPEHYEPLLYVLGARRDGEEPEFLTPEIMGSISMTSVAYGLGG